MVWMEITEIRPVNKMREIEFLRHTKAIKKLSII